MITAKRFALVLLSASALFADGMIIFPLPTPTPLYVKYHKVRCDIDNGVATTVIDQEFVNPLADALANGKYVFPVPKNAVITSFSIVVDGVEKQAAIMDATEAREFFNTAVKNSTLAALLQYTENQAYSLEIGSVAPGASRRVQISYVEILPKTDGLSRYLYPLNTEKFSMRLIDTVSITVSIRNQDTIASVFSPSYPVSVERAGVSAVTASYVAVKARPDRDFDLYYKLSGAAMSFHLFPYRKKGEDGYFLMLITPLVRENPDTASLIAKDMAFTIDRSGSMAGVKLQQAKDALTFCVNRLKPADYFHIVTFDNTIISNATEFLPATNENIPATIQFIQSILSGGNTDIAQALTTTLTRIPGDTRPHYLIFLTDGLPTAGVTDIGQISAQVNESNGKGARIFSVGFGYDVNTVLIDKISLDNGGFPLYCSPDQNIEEVIADLYKRIEAPLLLSPELTVESSAETYGISPEKLFDLFSGSEIAVYGRYKGQGAARVVLSGIVKDRSDTTVFTAEFPDSAVEYGFVPRLWATQQIARLLTRIKLQTMTQEDLAPLVDSVKALSLAYGIVTPYTSQIFTSSSSSWAGGIQTTNGRSANDASNSMQSMQQNSNSAQTVVADTNAVPYTVAPKTNQIQNADNKVFVYAANSMWVDASFDSTKPADTVYYGTDEYFSLAAQSTEILNLLSVGNQTAFNYQGKNYIIIDKNASAVFMPGKDRNGQHSGKPDEFTVIRKGTRLVFGGFAGHSPGSVTVYSASGTLVARIPVRSSQTVLQWNTGKAPIAGAYVAVYATAGERQVRKFVLLR
jgi:Ca-activated chloride channel family protein